MSENSTLVIDDQYLIRDEASLRALYKAPSERVLAAKAPHLNDEFKKLIRAARFVCIASEGSLGLDLSPRGGAPGIVQIIDDCTIAIPDMLGNNKLETMSNIVNGSGRVALLFPLPGLDYFVRINGTAQLSTDPSLLEQLQLDHVQAVKVAILIHTEEVYPHCSKATIRSEIWKSEGMLDHDSLPSMGQVVKSLITGSQ